MRRYTILPGAGRGTVRSMIAEAFNAGGAYARCLARGKD